MIKNTVLMSTLAVVLSATLVACDPKSNTAQEEGQRTQETVMQRAMQAQPTYQPEYFGTREQLNKWMERQDTPNRLYYIYIMNDMGGIVGYYVAQGRPVCTNTFLTPTEQLVHDQGQGTAMTTVPSPGLDGAYYGSAPCYQQFFFDAETDAMIEITGLNIMTMDQPLNVDAPELTFRNVDGE